MINQEEADELRMQYPERIYLVGGPYCGFYLMPHTELIGNVMTELTTKGIPPTITPTNFHPVDLQNIVFSGPLGMAWYRLEDDLRWTFKGWAYSDSAV